jgi:phage terminase large subunit-like protein
MTIVPNLSAAQLAKLSDAEAVELLELYEQLHRERRKERMAEYARYIEVPGTPGPASDDDRIRLLRRKEALRKRGEGGGWVDDEGKGEDVELEPEDLGLPTFYPQTLNPAAHHDLIMDSIQALMEEEPVTGPLANGHVGVVPEGVILMMPPGAAKSTYGSVVAPSYVMGRWPGTDVIGLSYAAALAHRFGRRVRTVCRSAKFSETFDHRGESVTVTDDNQAVDQWSLTNGSTYRAVGIMGGVTGNRADVCFIDDPIAGREEAESEIVREKTNVAIKDDVMTRLKPYGKVVMTLTRWHEDDPAGHVLGEDWAGQSGLWRGVGADGNKDGGRWWLVLCCPLLADSADDPLGRALGDRLWPEWFTARHVELARAAGERSWMSLQQQKPSASEGVIMLKRYWKCWQPMSRLWHGKPEVDPDLVLEENEPPRTWTQCVLCYDTAIEDGQDNDYSAMTAWAAFPQSSKTDLRRYSDKQPPGDQTNLVMLGAWRGKVQAVDLFRIVEQHVEFFKPDHIVVEKKASGHQLIQELRRRRPRYTDLGQTHHVAVHAWECPFPPGAKGKTPRAHSAAVSLEQGTTWYMPSQGATNVIKECAAVPNGKYDDWADTVTMMLIWARTFNLLEVPGDLIDRDEAESQEREAAIVEQDPRPLYGRNRAKPVSSAVRSLYGRSGKSKKRGD